MQFYIDHFQYKIAACTTHRNELIRNQRGRLDRSQVKITLTCTTDHFYKVVKIDIRLRRHQKIKPSSLLK